MVLPSVVEEPSVEATSLASTRQEAQHDPALALVSMPATDHAPLGSKSIAQYNRAYAQDGDWIQHKPLLKTLYMDENKTLSEVREYMRKEHRFTASWVYPQAK